MLQNQVLHKNNNENGEESVRFRHDKKQNHYNFSILSK